MSTPTTTDTDPWGVEHDDDVPMRPDGNVRSGWRHAPHFVEQACLVYLRLSDAGTRWIVDGPSLDGYPLDSAYEDLCAYNTECGCGQPEECEARRAAADALPLPTGRDLATLIIEALG